MKTLLILSVILSVALSIRAAAVVPTENAVVQLEDEPAPKPELKPASAPQARLQFCLDDWLSYNGNCYYIGNDFSTWGNAESFCSNFQANLASVRDIWEYNFIQRMVRSAGHKFAWIGGFHFENDWRWQDGSKFDYHRWETRNPSESYQCLQLDSETNKGWTNNVCSDISPFVCKTRPSC
ncbi:snaclec alboaggregin-A subunit beta'-like [Sphaeramia orbicularis]|uniref:snaclec alboaggregin-A subunit beta'-like n=1 Tax=Sphaeramia orbicularis TaxID=375764 RepID=UPI00117E4145|nr:snaclec alboaggregin-A subunit beta'-like [Sphaeramia orbicularis]